MKSLENGLHTTTIRMSGIEPSMSISSKTKRKVGLAHYLPSCSPVTQKWMGNRTFIYYVSIKTVWLPEGRCSFVPGSYWKNWLVQKTGGWNCFKKNARPQVQPISMYSITKHPILYESASIGIFWFSTSKNFRYAESFLFIFVFPCQWIHFIPFPPVLVGNSNR